MAAVVVVALIAVFAVIAVRASSNQRVMVRVPARITRRGARRH